MEEAAEINDTAVENERSTCVARPARSAGNSVGAPLTPSEFPVPIITGRIFLSFLTYARVYFQTHSILLSGAPPGGFELFRRDLHD